MIRLDIGRDEIAALFGNSSIPAILRVLTAEPGREYSFTELMAAGRMSSRDSVQRAVEALLAAGVIRERRAGRERRLRIELEALAAVDPYLRVPEPFRTVALAFVRELRKRVGQTEVWKILLFGGLARGRGDRLSDIDLLIVGPSPRPVRIEALRLANEFSTSGFQGQRYKVDVLVETPATLRERRADPLFPRLIREAVVLWDDGRHPLQAMIPEVRE